METLSEEGTIVRIEDVSIPTPDAEEAEVLFAGAVLERIREYCRDNDLPEAVSWCPTVEVNPDDEDIVSIICEVQEHTVTEEGVVDVVEERRGGDEEEAEEEEDEG